MTFVKNLIILVVFVLTAGMNSYSATADSFLEFGDLNFKADEGHWRFSVDLFNFDYISDLEFDGEYSDVKEDQEFDLPGAGITFGRDIYMGKGVGMNVNLTTIQAQLSEKEVGKISKEYDEDLVKFHNELSLTMAQVRADIYYTFETKYFLIRPLVGAGIAKGTLVQNINYSYDDQKEKYYIQDKQEVDITLTYIGAQFVSGGGLITEFRYGINNYSIPNRTQNGRVKNATEDGGDPPTTKIDEEITDGEVYSYDFASISIGAFF